MESYPNRLQWRCSTLNPGQLDKRQCLERCCIPAEQDTLQADQSLHLLHPVKLTTKRKYTHTLGKHGINGEKTKWSSILVRLSF